MTSPVVPVDLDDVRLRTLERQPAAKAGPAAAKELEVVFDRSVATSMAEQDPLGIVRGIGLKVGAGPADTKVGNPPEGTGESHEGRRQERATGT